MARFEMWVSETITKKIYFDADSHEHALGLFDGLSDVEEDLPNYSEKIKEYDIDYEFMSLQEMK